MNFSEDVWDHLPSRLPSRKDRDRLAALAASDDPDAVRRLRVWDFFFRPEPKEVAQEVRAEIWRQQQAADLEQKNGQAESRRLQNDLRAHVRKSEDQVERLVRDSAALAAASKDRVKQRAKRCKRCAVLSVVLAIGGAVSMATGEPIGALAGLGLLLCSVILMIKSAVLFVLFFDDRHKSARAESKKTRAEEMRAAAMSRTTSLEAEIEATKSASRLRRRELAESSRRLRALLDRLVDQIPDRIPADEIHSYLMDDLNALESYGEKKLGLPGRLAKVPPGVDNPARIGGPTEIQVAEAIPPSFLEEGSDKQKHLLAPIRVATLENGEKVALPATSYVAFLYIGEKALGVFRIFRDFITGRSVGGSFTTYYYHDIVSVERRNGYRPLRGIDGGSIDDALSLRVTSKDSQEIEITFASDEYLEHLGISQSLVGELDFHRSKGAGKAISCLREHVAKSKELEEREGSVGEPISDAKDEALALMRGAMGGGV